MISFKSLDEQKLAKKRGLSSSPHIKGRKNIYIRILKDYLLSNNLGREEIKSFINQLSKASNSKRKLSKSINK